MARAQGNRLSSDSEEVFGCREECHCLFGVGQRIHGGTSFGPSLDDTTIQQAGKVAGDSGLRQAEMLGELFDIVLSLEKMLHDARSRDIRKAVEETGCTLGGLLLQVGKDIFNTIGHMHYHRHTPIITS